MSRFSEIAKGVRAAKPMPPVTLQDGQAIECHVRVLTTEEEMDVLSDARKMAQKKGVEDPKPEQEIYERALMVYRARAACVDESGRPYFDVTVEEMMRHPGLDDDRLAFICEFQRRFQDEQGIRPIQMSSDEFMEWVFQVAEGEADDPRPLLRLRPVLLWSCMRTLAGLYTSSLRSRSSSGESFTSGTESANERGQ